MEEEEQLLAVLAVLAVFAVVGGGGESGVGAGVGETSVVTRKGVLKRWEGGGSQDRKAKGRGGVG